MKDEYHSGYHSAQRPITADPWGRDYHRSLRAALLIGSWLVTSESTPSLIGQLPRGAGEPSPEVAASGKEVEGDWSTRGATWVPRGRRWSEDPEGVARGCCCRRCCWRPGRCCSCRRRWRGSGRARRRRSIHWRRRRGRGRARPGARGW